MRCFSSTIAKYLALRVMLSDGAQKQKTAWVQRVVKCLHHPVLQLGVEVDQDVAAGDQIEPREGRILDDAMHGEGAQLADLTPQTIVVAVFDKPPLQALGRNPGDGLAVAATPGDRYGVAHQCRCRRF